MNDLESANPSIKSWLYQYCGGAMEACLLAAVAVVPLLMDPISDLGYQPQRAMFVQCLALILLVCFITRRTEELAGHKSHPIEGQQWLLNPILIGIAAWIACHLVSTLFSVHPRQSFWGRIEWQQGALTIISLGILGAGAACCLRSATQRNRLLTVALLASVPVALYAILQHYARPRVIRPASLMGSSVFLADYLAMVLPLTLWRCISLGTLVYRRCVEKAPTVASLVFYGFLALLQSLALIFTASRGAVLALIAGLSMGAILIAAYYNRRRYLLHLAIGIGLAGLLMFAWFRAIGSQSTPLLVNRFTRTFTKEDQSGSIRLAMWQGAARVMLSSEPMPYPQGGQDRWHSLRLLLGYGPETVVCVLPHYFTDPNGGYEPQPSIHNMAWDVCVSLGLLGLLVQMSIQGLVFHKAYETLGLMSSRRAAMWFGCLYVLSCLAGAGLTAFYGGAGLAGPGLQAGSFVGLALFPLLKKGGGSLVAGRAGEKEKAHLTMALVGTLTVHLLGTISEPPAIVSLMLFWILAGLIAIPSNGSSLSVVSGSMPLEDDSPGEKDAEERRDVPPAQVRRRWSFWKVNSIPSFIACLITFTISFGFVHCIAGQPLSGWEVLTKCWAMTLKPFYGLLFPLLFIPVWIAAQWLLMVEANPNQNAARCLRGFGWGLLASGGLSLGYALFKAAQLGSIGRPLSSTTAPITAIEMGIGYERTMVIFVAILFFMVLFGGVLLSPTNAFPSAATSRLGLITFCTTLGAAFMAIWFWAMPVVRADNCASWANFLSKIGLNSLAVDVQKRALHLNPMPFYYYPQYAMALNNLAVTSRDETTFAHWQQQREAVLLTSQKYSSLNRGELLMGLGFLEWAAREKETERRRELALRASQSLRRAAVFEPAYAVIPRTGAIVDAVLLRQPEAALLKKRESLEIADTQNNAEYGRYFLDASITSLSPAIRVQYALASVDHYDRAIRSAHAAKRPSSAFEFNQARACLFAKDMDRAVETWKLAVEKAPPEEAWRSEFFLAEFFLFQNDKASAFQHAEAAISLAPIDEMDQLTRLRNALMSPQ